MHLGFVLRPEHAADGVDLGPRIVRVAFTNERVGQLWAVILL